jgi:hypothetical protein
MENQRTIEYCIKSELEMLFYIANEVENRLKLSKSYCCSCKQVNFGLEISMNDTNYLISSQHLPFRINTLC